MPSPPSAGRERVHGTCVALEGGGVLLLGPSGAGKSDLALRLIDSGARLVGDDCIELARDGDHLVASLPTSAPRGLRGRLEVRGIGIVPVRSRARVRLGLVVELRPDGPIERQPGPAFYTCLGVRVPLVVLDPFTASAAAKVRLAVHTLPGDIIPPP